VFAAIRALGIADSTQLDSLGASSRRTRLTAKQRDSIFMVDTLQPALKNDTTKTAVRRLLQRSRALQRAQTDSGYDVFGLDLFKSEPTQFDPNTGEVEKSMPLAVTRDGFVVIPAVGQVNVAGLTRAQLEDALYTRLGRVYSGVRRGTGATTHFYVDVASMG